VLLACAAVTAWSGWENASADADAETLFVRRIEPLLAAKCAACHGTDADDIEGGLSLASAAGLAAGGDSGTPAVVPGRPEESPLYLAAGREHAEWSPMPPKEAERLTAEELGWIREWIAAGGTWPSAERKAAIVAAHAAAWSAEDGVTVPTSGGLADAWTSRRYKPEALWAYRPVVKPAVPAAPAGTQPIDAFIAARLPAGLTVAAPADRRTLLRRVTFDLTGLPPTPAETEAFLGDRRSDDEAFRDVVERLLASPHHGERMAQHWLDVVRYADSSGFANDYERGNAWRYRDWVVRAFNADMPFDRFVRDQIAGDEIDPADPARVVATGFLRMGPWELTGMEVAKVARQRFLDDVTNSVGETFLGHALQCARCHDHKFDPVPTRDYYAIQAVFATTQLAEREAAFLPEENTAGFAEAAYLERARADHAAALERIDAAMLAAADAWFAERGRDPTRWKEAVASAKAARGNGGVFAKARDKLLDAGVPEDEFPPRFIGLEPEQIGLERVARKGLERLAWEFDRYQPVALAVYSGRTLQLQMKTVFKPLRMPADRMTRGDLEETCILGGGDPFSPTTPVAPGVLSAIADAGTVTIPAELEGRRRAFAEWVAGPDNPLTPRVIVNRVWMWHFGEPLAGNPNNFGGTGKRPTHPELLDWLAATFVEEGWSFKSLHRRILASEAYRRSTRHPDAAALASLDPQGTSLAVFRPRRLSAEELRDAMLAVTGELNPAIGGIPVRPEIHPEAALQPRQVMGTFAAAWTPNPLPADRHRRSLYALKLRGLTDPALEIFNAPAPDFSCERRDASTVTPQVFALFNSRAGIHRAVALASRALAETRAETPAAGDAATIDRCFAVALGRPPRAEERDACLAHWREMEAVESRAEYLREPLPLEIRREAVEENTGETFSFTERLHAHADFVPDRSPADCDARTRALADVCLVLFNTNEFAYVY
jgi:cytochrome c553